MGAAEHPEDSDQLHDTETREGEERPVDRSHNRDILSSEAMTEMLRDVQDSMLALDERLGSLEAAHGHASAETRRLATGVADMGDALARRVRALEGGAPATAPMIAAPAAHKPARRPPERPIAWSVGMAFVLAAALAAFWLFSSENLDQATIVAAPKPVVPVPVAAPPVKPPPPPPAATSAKPTSAPHTPQKSTHGAATFHYSTSTHRQASPSTASPTPTSTNSTAGFGRYGPSTATNTASPPH